MRLPGTHSYTVTEFTHFKQYMQTRWAMHIFTNNRRNQASKEKKGREGGQNNLQVLNLQEGSTNITQLASTASFQTIEFMAEHSINYVLQPTLETELLEPGGMRGMHPTALEFTIWNFPGFQKYLRRSTAKNYFLEMTKIEDSLTSSQSNLSLQPFDGPGLSSTGLPKYRYRAHFKISVSPP